jgi:hypothetical protein
VTYRKLLIVNNNILLTKLKRYGITGISLEVIKSYLEGKYQRVIPLTLFEIGEIMVSHRDQYLVHCFFYINDLPSTINDNAEIILFADDISTIITSRNPMNFKSSVNKNFQGIN